MKWKTLLPVIALLCTSCKFSFVSKTSEDTPSTTPPSVTTTITTESSSSSSSDISSSSATKTPVTIPFYGINDFHGAVVPASSQPGLESLGAYLKSIPGEGAVLVDSGDMYQGSIESNYNRGELVSRVMKEIGFDAFAIGNHEFDWGDEAIKRNAEWSEVPFLGANIYHFDMSSKTQLDFASDLCQKYTIVERSGWKIGIIGTIGQGQTADITSTFVDDYSFADPIPIIKTVSDELRIEQGCDIVVVSHHGPQDDLINNGLTRTSPSSGKRYIDAAFCGHTHKNESTTENGVAFVQTEGYGQRVACINLSVSEAGVQTDSFTTSLNPSGYKDEAIASLISQFKEVSDLASKEVLCSADATYYNRYEVTSNLAPRAIYEKAKEEGHVVDLALTNTARAALRASNYQITYGELYTSLPFDNDVILARVSGNDIINELSYSSTYAYNPDGITFRNGQKYTIAVIDYVGLHRGANRNYNYFPSLEPFGLLEGNYRDISAEYLRKIGTFRGEDFANTLSCFDKNWY